MTNDPNLPNAVICDLDGTLALFGEANPYDRDFTKDTLNKSIAHILRIQQIATFEDLAPAKIILVSGRMDKFREQTERWLANKDVPYDALYMRKTGDIRKDTIIKEEIYEEHIKGKYNVLFVLDDRLQVCRLWHGLGLPLFRFGDPDADF